MKIKTFVAFAVAPALLGFLFTSVAFAQPDTDSDKTAEHVEEIAPKASPGFAALGALGLLPSPAPTISYSGWITPRQAPGEVDQNKLTIQVPVYRSHTDTFSMSLGGTSLHFGEPQQLSGSGLSVPQDLWKAELGASYSHNFGNNKFFGGGVSVGSASDHPFANFDVTTIGASAYYSWSHSDHTRWLVTLFFSNNNALANYVPIPGFVYVYESKTLIGMFGFPFTSVVWMPAHPWMFTFSIFGPTINSEAAYGDPTKWQLFTGFSWTQQSFIPENRPQTKDRLYYDEKHAPLGVRFPVAKHLKAEFSGGYSFDRSVYESPRYFGHKDEGTTKIGDSWYGACNLKLEI